MDGGGQDGLVGADCGTVREDVEVARGDVAGPREADLIVGLCAVGAELARDEALLDDRETAHGFALAVDLRAGREHGLLPDVLKKPQKLGMERRADPRHERNAVEVVFNGKASGASKGRLGGGAHGRAPSGRKIRLHGEGKVFIWVIGPYFSRRTNVLEKVRHQNPKPTKPAVCEGRPASPGGACTGLRRS